MKTSKIILGLIILVTVVAFGSHAVSAQEDREGKEGKRRQQCTVDTKNIYFVDSGKVVAEMHPGSNGGNGYQLNILGINVDKLEVIQESYMSSVGVIPNYTSATAAKWGFTFNPNMARMIRNIKMKNKCTGVTKDYRLDAPVKLLNN
jgi:hypothetical protein